MRQRPGGRWCPAVRCGTVWTTTRFFSGLFFFLGRRSTTLVFFGSIKVRCTVMRPQSTVVFRIPTKCATKSNMDYYYFSNSSHFQPIHHIHLFCLDNWRVTSSKYTSRLICELLSQILPLKCTSSGYLLRSNTSVVQYLSLSGHYHTPYTTKSSPKEPHDSLPFLPPHARPSHAVIELASKQLTSPTVWSGVFFVVLHDPGMEIVRHVATTNFHPTGPTQNGRSGTGTGDPRARP